MKRRNFVKTLASLAAVGSVSSVASAASFGVDPVSAKPESSSPRGRGFAGPAAGTPRSFGASHFSLQINGSDVGFLESVEGGNAVADVVVEGAHAGFATKRIGAVKYEPLRLKLPAPVHADVTKLIADSIAGGGAIKSLAIVSYDLNMKAVAQRDVSDALLTEFGFEQLDAASKSPLHMVLGFQPASVRSVEKAGEAGKIGAKTKTTTEGSFKLTLDGIETRGVVSIKPLIAKRSTATATVGGSKVSAQVGNRFEVEAIDLQVSSAQAQPFFDWFEEFAIKRNKVEERGGKLELLGADLKTVLYTVNLAGVGISALRVEEQSSGDKLSRVRATLYAERLAFAG